ncbi:hypothetical protein [Bifidobacterium thermophilum]|nr:hypothetical protein [Bifidobacterium thermophilum]
MAGLSEQISRSGRLATLLFYAVPPVREKRTEVSHMTSNGNQSQRIYDKATRTWYEVPEDQYKEFDRWRTNLRKREQYWGRCFCPRGKWWPCDGNCVECEFHTRNEVPLDDPLPDGAGMRGDYVPDDNPTPEEITADRDLLERLTARLHELDPDEHESTLHLHSHSLRGHKSLTTLPETVRGIEPLTKMWSKDEFRIA